MDFFGSVYDVLQLQLKWEQCLFPVLETILLLCVK